MCKFEVMKPLLITKIEAPRDMNKSEGDQVVQRLYDLGLYPGLEIHLERRVSFGGVTIIAYQQTRLALNRQEMSCLHGPW